MVTLFAIHPSQWMALPSFKVVMLIILMNIYSLVYIINVVTIRLRPRRFCLRIGAFVEFSSTKINGTELFDA